MGLQRGEFLLALLLFGDLVVQANGDLSGVSLATAL